MTDVLLDTHAWIWFAEGDPTLSQAARDAIAEAGRSDGAYVPAISFWEIGMLADRGRVRLRLPLDHWIDYALSVAGLHPVDLSPAIALAASRLPGDLHKDPADRLIAATARELGCPLITRGRGLLAYAAAGHLDVIPA